MRTANQKAIDSKAIKDKLAKKHACYVLVTCDKPTEDGNMQVEMSYHGDVALASMLLQGAQTYMDEEHETPQKE